MVKEKSKKSINSSSLQKYSKTMKSKKKKSNKVRVIGGRTAVCKGGQGRERRRGRER